MMDQAKSKIIINLRKIGQHYLSETLTWLEEQAPQNFFPNLEKLDLMMASFEINR